jgi:hypothetical protein
VKKLQFLILFSLSLVISSCTSKIPNKNPLNQTFPSVMGKSLSDKDWKIPGDFKGKKVLLIVGYKMDSQFDIDRWLLGLNQLKASFPIYEIPTISGMVPLMISKKIDKGMKKGIPSEDWFSVITVYKDSEKIINFTGNTNPNNGRVMMLNSEGKVIYFHDKGYSAKHLMRLMEVANNAS